MNLHGIVGGVVGAINPQVQVVVQVSTGSIVGPDGIPTPSYAPPVAVYGQVQPLSQRDLRQVESLNLQGTLRAIYITGNVDGVVRVQLKGGDLIDVTVGPNAGRYLVTLVDEAWPDWSKSICTLQDGI